MKLLICVSCNTNHVVGCNDGDHDKYCLFCSRQGAEQNNCPFREEYRCISMAIDSTDCAGAGEHPDDSPSDRADVPGLPPFYKPPG